MDCNSNIDNHVWFQDYIIHEETGIKIDLHIHSKYSGDGVLSPKDIVIIAQKRGLDSIAITDHNTIRGAKEAKKFETDNFKVIIGTEVMTEYGEITGLFLQKEISSRRIQAVIKEIKAQGGMVIVPHPFDTLRRSAFHITSEYIGIVDAIEVFNSRCVFQCFNTKAQEFAARYCMPVVGGSDAHFGNEIGLAGIITDSDDIREAILQKNIKVFGIRSPLINHVRTKFLKTVRRYSVTRGTNV